MLPEMSGQIVPMPLPVLPPHIQQMMARIDQLRQWAGMVNVADELDEVALGKIGAKVVREYQIDKDSRKEWEDRARRAMDLARQKKDEKSFPWPKASNV